MKNVLIIGGSGLIGSELAKTFASNNYSVFSIALNQNITLPDCVNQWVCNRKNVKAFTNLLRELTKTHRKWDLVIDVIPFSEEDAKLLHKELQTVCQHFIIVSSTLVYQLKRKQKQLINEDFPKQKYGTAGQYVDRKLETERFWQNSDSNYTIIRPHHILGVDASLGCIPLHNRDIDLIEHMSKGYPLTLLNGGNLQVSFIHVKDLAYCVLLLSNNTAAYSEAFNLVFPQTTSALDYYQTIARLIKANLSVRAIDANQVFTQAKGWYLTMLNHQYDASKLYALIGFEPKFNLERAIASTLENYPSQATIYHAQSMNHRLNSSEESHLKDIILQTLF